MAVFILTAFVCVAMLSGHRELFTIAVRTTQKSHSLAGNKNYKYIDEKNKGVCYPSENKVRSELSGGEACTSYRFQNPAFHKNQIFLGDGSSTNPLSLIEFSNGETLENEIISPAVKNKVEGLLNSQSQNYDEIVKHGENFKEQLENARELRKGLEPVDDYTVEELNRVIEGVPSPPDVPMLDSGSTQSPCSNSKCVYKDFEYTTKEYGPLGSNIVSRTVPPTSPKSAQAMLISNVQSPALIQFQDTCSLT